MNLFNEALSTMGSQRGDQSGYHSVERRLWWWLVWWWRDARRRSRLNASGQDHLHILDDVLRRNAHALENVHLGWIALNWILAYLRITMVDVLSLEISV